MLGAFYYFLHITIIRNSIFLVISFLILYFSSDYNLFLKVNLSNINDFENIILDYFDSSNITNLFDIFFYSLIGLNVINLMELIIFYDYIALPYSLNLTHKIKNLNRDNGNITILDKFSFRPFSLNERKISFRNKISIDKSRYEDNIEQIREFLRIDANSEILLNQISRKTIELSINHIPKKLELDTNKIIENKIYLGESFNEKDLYIDFENLTHILTVGESGSGKSTLINLMLLSVLKNINLCEKLFLVDFKGVELYRYSKLEKVEFIDKVESLIDTLENLTSIMNERYEKLKETNELKHKGEYIFVVLEEVGSISTFQDTKVKNRIFNLLINLLQKARAANIYFLVFAQKIEVSVLPSSITTNIQSKILLKTDNDYNQQQTIGTKEIISKITNLEPGNFPRGRGVFKCGISSDSNVFQAPYFHKDTFKIFD